MKSSSKIPASHAAPDLLCFSHLRWHFVTQRPQHLLSRAAKTQRVFFWEEPIWHEAGELPLRANQSPGMHVEVLHEAENLWILIPHLTHGIPTVEGQRQLLSELMQRFAVENYICWYYTPMALAFTSELSPGALIYDCMDELTGFLGAPPELASRERELLTAAEIVFTGGISLYEAKRTQHGNVHSFPSSIDVEHFAQALKPQAEPDDQARIPHPIAGFFGVLDERFDLALFAAVAQARPQLNFVVLGPVVKIDPVALPQAPNIHYLGAKTYSELPRYLSGWKAALLPFALNDATRFISPTKTPEYLAAGVPAVSTAIRDVVRSYGDTGLVAIAHDPQEFVEALDRALEPQTDAWRESVAHKLRESSWDSTWAAMQSEINKVLDQSQNETHGASASHHANSSLFPFRLETAAATRPKSRHMANVDYLIAGAGFAGAVLAERIASQLNKRVLVVDPRDHIGGNAYDHRNAEGILVHKYGPHIFHTNSDAVATYLSSFTDWLPYEHRVLSEVDGMLLPVPINLDTINSLYNTSLDAEGMRAFLGARAITPRMIRTSEDVVISRVGRELYEKFFRNYTRKQWGLDPSELDASVAGRIPVRFDHDDRYFSDSFQAMPRHGYTAMFERILDHRNIDVRTGTVFEEARQIYPNAKVIYTGPIDAYFGFKYGELPYRSLEFKHETHDREIYQAAPVINYPNQHAYTRVTEFKYMTGQQHAKTSIVYEYPQADGDPYYPIPRPENALLYAKYRALADQEEGVHFCGRLANYRYLNMDQVVAQALATFRLVASQEHRSFGARPLSASSISVGPRVAAAPIQDNSVV